MSRIKLYSNFIKKPNATELDTQKQKQEIHDIVKQAIDSGVKEIYFNYEEGPDAAGPMGCGGVIV